MQAHTDHRQEMAPKDIERRIAIEQLHVYVQQLQAISIAPALGGAFTTWVLWDAVDRRYLLIGLAAVLTVSFVRLGIYWWYRNRHLAIERDVFWSAWLTAIALVSGITWGSAAFFIYPPQQSEYEIYLLVLMALVPVAPIAALATHLPSFFAYYLPCILPFVAVLAWHEPRADKLTALLLLMMMGATITFAVRYNRALTDAIRLRLQLSDQKDVLVETAQIKSRFMAAASHDLRQPIHAMGLFLETLRRRVAGSDLTSVVERIEESTRSLRRMLDSTLDISRLDAGAVEVDRHDFNVDDVLRLLYNEFAPLAQRKGLRLRYVPSRLMINSDPVLLEMIVRNLLINAIKYTRHGGVLLGCRRRGCRLAVQIYDTGIGIPDAEIGVIFREFTQLGVTGFNPERGLGLGLAIVERLAGLLDHPLHVGSVVGCGSVFTITLPIVADPVRIRQRMQEEDSDPLLAGVDVAVMDDDPDAVASMRSLLQQWGARVVQYPSVMEAFDHVGARLPPVRLLIVDYHLASGWTAPQVIRRLTAMHGKAPKILIVTGDTSTERIREAHQNGHLLLHKPVALPAFKNCIKLLTGELSEGSVQ